MDKLYAAEEMSTLFGIKHYHTSVTHSSTKVSKLKRYFRQINKKMDMRPY